MADDTAGLIADLGFECAETSPQSLPHATRPRPVAGRDGRAGLVIRTGRTSATAPQLWRAHQRHRDRDGASEEYIGCEWLCFTRDYPFERRLGSRVACIVWDRCWYPPRRRPPDGGRPECSPSDGPLKSVAVPTVVFRGDADQLVNPTGSEAQAALISGAKLRRSWS
jgi:hypothetical protein